MSMVSLHPIGTVKVEASDDTVRARMRKLDCESGIEVFEDFQDALDGLAGFSHIFVLSYLNKLRPEQIGVLKVKPRRLLLKGFNLEELPLVGGFRD